MKTLVGTAAGRRALPAEEPAPPQPVVRGKVPGRLRRLVAFLRGGTLERVVAEDGPRAAAREDGRASRAPVDAGLSRGATLLFGPGPGSSRRR